MRIKWESYCYVLPPTDSRSVWHFVISYCSKKDVFIPCGKIWESLSPQGRRSWPCRRPTTTTPRQTTCGSSTVWLDKSQRALVPSSEWTVTQGSSPSKQTVWRAQRHSTHSQSLLRMPKVNMHQCTNTTSLKLQCNCCFYNLTKSLSHFKCDLASNPNPNHNQY